VIGGGEVSQKLFLAAAFLTQAAATRQGGLACHSRHSHNGVADVSVHL
jgi:hypothetical protein